MSARPSASPPPPRKGRKRGILAAPRLADSPTAWPPWVVIGCLLATALLLIPQSFVTTAGSSWHCAPDGTGAAGTLAVNQPPSSATAPRPGHRAILGFLDVARNLGQITGPIVGGYVGGTSASAPSSSATSALLLVVNRLQLARQPRPCARGASSRTARKRRVPHLPLPRRGRPVVSGIVVGFRRQS